MTPTYNSKTAIQYHMIYNNCPLFPLLAKHPLPFLPQIRPLRQVANKLHGYIYSALATYFYAGIYLHADINAHRCVYVCAAIPFDLNVWFVDIPAEATQEEGHSGFLHLHRTGLTVVLIQQGCSCFLARRSSSRILCMNELIIPHLSDYVLSKQQSGVELGTAPELS